MKPPDPRSNGRFVAATLAITLTLVGAAGARAAAPADTIVLRQGRPLVVDTVIADTYEKVEYRKGAIVASQPASKVVTVEYGEAPRAYAEALAARAAGDLPRAAELLEGVLAGASGAGFRTACGLDLAETLRELAAREPANPARLDSAIAAYDAVLAATRSRLRPAALLGRLRCDVARSDLPAALAARDRLKAESATNRYPSSFRLEADLAVAAAFAADDPAAESAYQALESLAREVAAGGREAPDSAGRTTSTGTSTESSGATDRARAEEIAWIARLGAVRCGLARDSSPESIERCAALAADAAAPEAVRAAAETSVGRAHLARGSIRAAEHAFARVRVRHHFARDAVAEATYRLGAIARVRSEGAADPVAAARAAAYFREVVDRYAETAFARPAQDALDSLGAPASGQSK